MNFERRSHSEERANSLSCNNECKESRLPKRFISPAITRRASYSYDYDYASTCLTTLLYEASVSFCAALAVLAANDSMSTDPESM
jgi:hypothetical protein